MVKIKFYDPNTLKHARELRKNSTPWERKLWSFLKSSKFYGFKFRRQFPIGPYIVDFCCVKQKLVIELDGSQHANPAEIAHDGNRDTFLKQEGYRILRIWNNEMDSNLEGLGNKLYGLLSRPNS